MGSSVAVSYACRRDRFDDRPTRPADHSRATAMFCILLPQVGHTK
ncbi:hypothetical protein HSR121_2448 [Halapricum desulfuricans]|uniref:Uncharacterized protein n=1 Tax=Halapricum desulfuricans TaxID=2841257 RepID=A0A897N6U3_9EURY|nr:hypothetical protein HSR121_2448 [Halapricum desulfuricans]